MTVLTLSDEITPHNLSGRVTVWKERVSGQGLRGQVWSRVIGKCPGHLIGQQLESSH